MQPQVPQIHIRISELAFPPKHRAVLNEYGPGAVAGRCQGSTQPGQTAAHYTDIGFECFLV